MLAYTYIEHGKFELIEKPKPGLKDPRDAIVRVTLGSICTSDLDTRMPSSVSHLEVFVPVIYTSNTEVYPVPYRALPLGMKWWVL